MMAIKYFSLYCFSFTELFSADESFGLFFLLASICSQNTGMSQGLQQEGLVIDA